MPSQLRMKQFRILSSSVITVFSRGDHAGYAVAMLTNDAARRSVPFFRWQDVQLSAFPTKGLERRWSRVFSTRSRPSLIASPSGPSGIGRAMTGDCWSSASATGDTPPAATCRSRCRAAAPRRRRSARWRGCGRSTHRRCAPAPPPARSAGEDGLRGRQLGATPLRRSDLRRSISSVMSMAVEIDKPKRDAMIKEASTRLRDAYTYVPLYHPILAWATRKGVKVPITLDNLPHFAYARFLN